MGSVILGSRKTLEGQCKSELIPYVTSYSSKVCYQNLNPLALSFEPKSKHFVFNSSFQPYSYSTLNPSAQIFVPLSSLNSNDISFDFDITPEVFDSTTPNSSIGGILDTLPTQRSLTSILHNLLNSFELILMIFIVLILLIFAIMLFNVVVESSDQDHSDLDLLQNILQSLTLKTATGSL